MFLYSEQIIFCYTIYLNNSNQLLQNYMHIKTSGFSDLENLPYYKPLSFLSPPLFQFHSFPL